MTGFIAVTTNAGIDWLALSIEAGTIPNDWSDSPSPTVPDLEFIQLRGDIHNLDRFYAAGNWLNDTSQRRGWIGLTTDNGVNFDWTSIIQTISIDFSASHESGVLLDYYDSTFIVGTGTIAVTMASALNGTVYGLEAGVSNNNDEAVAIKALSGAPSGDEYTISFYFDPNSITIAASATGFTENLEPCLFRDSSDVDLGFLLVGNKTGVGYVIRLYWYDDNTTLFFNSTGVPISDAPQLIEIIVTKASSAVAADGSIVLKSDGVTLVTHANFDYFDDYSALNKLLFGIRGAEPGCSGTWYLDEMEVALGGLTDSAQTHLLSMTTDLDDGDTMYITAWKDGAIYLDRYDTATMTLIASLSLGAATIGQVDAKTYFVVVFPSPFADVAGFGETVWVYGRWYDGVNTLHIAKSIDSGQTISSIGDSSWTTERVGAFTAISNTNLLAALDDGTLWETTDGGTTWTQIQSLGLAPEFKALSKHAGGRLLMGANTTGAPQAVWIDSPYNGGAIIDATGPAAGTRLPGAGDGGSGVNAIVWVG